MRVTPSVYLVGSTPEGLSGVNATGKFDCHVYLVKGPSGLFLIDAGSGYDTAGILRNIEEEGFRPRDISHILITHHHVDHGCGAKTMRDALGCEVLISSNTGKHLLEEGTDEELGIAYAKEHGMYPKDFVFTHCPVDRAIDDGEEFDIGGIRIRAINVIGHSHDSLCFLMNLDGRRCLFNGDTFYHGGVLGLLNYPMSSMEWYHEGLPKLKDLTVEGFFPGHGVMCVRNGQAVIDAALNQLRSLFVPHSVGQDITYHV